MPGRTITDEDLRMTREEIRVFVHNAQRALADFITSDNDMDLMALYAEYLEELFLEESKFTPQQLAFVLVSVAYNLVFKGEKPGGGG